MRIINVIDKVLQYVGKIILYIIGCLLTVVFCIIIFLVAAEWLWPEFNGSYSLGKNIYMIEWDGGGRVIVQGSNIRGNTCYGGSQLIPSYESLCDSLGNLVEYVVDAKADDKWIIAETYNKSSMQRKYYIIDKRADIEKYDARFIIKTFVSVFYDRTNFQKACFSNGIKIKFSSKIKKK